MEDVVVVNSIDRGYEFFQRASQERDVAFARQCAAARRGPGAGGAGCVTDEVSAANEFHREEPLGPKAKKFVQSHEVRMIEPLEKLLKYIKLVSESAKCVIVKSVQQLDRDFLVGCLVWGVVLRGIDNPEPAFAETSELGESAVSKIVRDAVCHQGYSPQCKRRRHDTGRGRLPAIILPQRPWTGSDACRGLGCDYARTRPRQ